MYVPHSIRLTIQLTIDSESFRELTNTIEERGRSTISFTKEPLLRQLSIIWEEFWPRVRSWLLSLVPARKTRNINCSIAFSSRT